MSASVLQQIHSPRIPLSSLERLARSLDVDHEAIRRRIARTFGASLPEHARQAYRLRLVDAVEHALVMEERVRGTKRGSARMEGR